MNESTLVKNGLAVQCVKRSSTNYIINIGGERIYQDCFGDYFSEGYFEAYFPFGDYFEDYF